MAKFRLLAVMAFSLWAFASTAQESCYMVFFADKDDIAQRIDMPGEFLSERAIMRCVKAGVEITAQDLPVSPDYVNSVRSTGAHTLYKTKWLNGVLVRCGADLVPALKALPFVTAVEYVGPVPEAMLSGRRSFNLRTKERRVGVETESQLKMIGADRMHQAGFTGEGITIAILDSGFPGVSTSSAFSHILSNGTLQEDVSYNFVRNSPDVYQEDDHGTEVLSVIAANIPDAYTGVAYDATFQLFVTEDARSEYRIEEYNWLFAAERADSAGVDIIHSSLGYYDFDDPSMNYTREQMDGRTTVVSRAAKWASERGIVVVTSAGNEGSIPSWRIITAPADVDGVVAVGSVNSLRQKTGSSSIGPTADGRIKPDVAALGQGVKVVRASGQVGSSSGTSFSAPLVTGLVAGIWQRYPELNAREVVALLKETASQASQPDNLLGYGIPDFRAVENYMAEVPQNGVFEIFPNPLKTDTLTIRPKDPDMANACSIEIISAQGRLLETKSIRFSWLQRTHHANFSALPAGIYFIRIISGKTHHTFRLVRL